MRRQLQAWNQAELDSYRHRTRKRELLTNLTLTMVAAFLVLLLAGAIASVAALTSWAEAALAPVLPRFAAQPQAIAEFLSSLFFS